jgi:ribosomal protein S10
VISRPTLRRVIEEVQQRAEEQGMPIMGGKPLPDDVRRAIVTKVQKDLWEQQRKDFFVNCWHANAIESMAMWDLYSNKGVAIRSTVERLLLAFEGQAQACWVTYVDHGAEEDASISMSMKYALISSQNAAPMTVGWSCSTSG